MTGGWHWFVIIGVLGSLAGFAWLLLANRSTSDQPDTGHEWDGIQELDNPLPLWWVYMFFISIFFALGYMALFPGLGNYDGALGWSSSGKHDAEADAFAARFEPIYQELAALDDEALLDHPQAGQIGRRLFLNNCSTCHGVNAQGADGFPNLQDSEWIWGSGLAAVSQSILAGRIAAMPGWVGALKEEGVTEVSHYVLSLSGAEHDASLAEKGAKHYQLYCVACHQADGSGMAALGAPNLTNDTWLYGGSLASIEESVRNGRNGRMPACEELLGRERSRILAAYVVGLSQPQQVAQSAP